MARINLRLTGPMDQLSIVWQAGEVLLADVPFEHDPVLTRQNVLLSLQEMVTNVLRHAYECDETRPIELDFEASESGFAVVLRDEGPAFDPLGHDSGILAEDEVMPTESGGWGIRIARLLMDEVEYARIGDKNELRMKKFAQTSSRVQ